MKCFFILTALFVFVSCKTTLKESDKEDEELMTNFPMKTVIAKVIYEPFVNKAGRLIEGAGDLFLVYDDQSWFIKFSAGTVLRSEVEKFIDTTATFSVMEMEGLWDTDDPNVQSRVGRYVAVFDIID